MPCSINFLITLQTEVLSTEASDFLKQIIFLRSFNSMFIMFLLSFLEVTIKRYKINKKNYDAMIMIFTNFKNLQIKSN